MIADTNLLPTELTLYTFATTVTNPGPGSYAVVWRGGHTEGEWSAVVEHSTAVRLAMQAILEGLAKAPPASRIRVLTGMQHIADAFTKGWIDDWRENNWRRTSAKKGIVANADLWEALDDFVKKSPIPIKIVHGLPKGPELTRCRKLAKAKLQRMDMQAD